MKSLNFSDFYCLFVVYLIYCLFDTHNIPIGSYFRTSKYLFSLLKLMSEYLDAVYQKI